MEDFQFGKAILCLVGNLVPTGMKMVNRRLFLNRENRLGECRPALLIDPIIPFANHLGRHVRDRHVF